MYSCMGDLYESFFHVCPCLQNPVVSGACSLLINYSFKFSNTFLPERQTIFFITLGIDEHGNDEDNFAKLQIVEARHNYSCSWYKRPS